MVPEHAVLVCKPETNLENQYGDSSHPRIYLKNKDLIHFHDLIRVLTPLKSGLDVLRRPFLSIRKGAIRHIRGGCFGWVSPQTCVIFPRGYAFSRNVEMTCS